jgi:hypothetical protein
MQYGRPLLQQGRVLLDADFNAQGAAFARETRMLIRDLLGPHAGPSNDLGFTLSVVDGRLAIGYGHYYVDGLLAANETSPHDTDTVTAEIPPLFYDEQPGYPFPDSIAAADFAVDQPYFFYLDVWEHLETWFERAEIREIALGGPDTVGLVRVAWAVKAVKMPQQKFSAANGLPEKWLDANLQRFSRFFGGPGTARFPEMQAWTDPQDNPDAIPCIVDPLGGYHGLENQLYRVEIHNGTATNGGVTFKWSRENGSVMAAWTGQDGTDLVVEGVHDTAHGFAAGQWVELSDEVGQLLEQPGVMVRLVKVEQNRLTYDPATASGPIPVRDQMLNPIVRRWDQQGSKTSPLTNGVVPLTEDSEYTLESGIKIRFLKPSANPATYRTGDYWVIPARTASGDIEWPSHMETVGGQSQKVYDFRDPDGISHAYCPLAIVTQTGTNPPAFTIASLQRRINQLWSAA